MAKEIVIEDLITKALREKEKTHQSEHKKQECWYASSLGSCLRGQYFARLGEWKPPPPNDRELRVFDVGNQMEKWLVDLIKGQGEVETQIRLYSEKWNIAGRPDLIKDGKVYEIKTKHSKAFWYMLKSGKPMRQHEQQLWFYLKMLNLPEGNLVYLSKDDLAIQEYSVRLDDELLAKEVIAQLKLLNKAWESKDPSILPLPRNDEWQAKYCKFHNDFCTKV